jgi:alpha-glucosidase
MLTHYRAALAFRHAHATLAAGDMMDIAATGEVAHFIRHGDETIFCAFNLSGEEASISLPAGTWVPIGPELGSVAPAAGKVRLPAWGVALATKT